MNYNLLKAIGKTILSLLKWILIMIAIIGGVIICIRILQAPNNAEMFGNVILSILGITILGLLGLLIVMETKDNYEKVAKKSIKNENNYKIYYNVVREKDRVVSGKTKKQAIENLYMKETEGEYDVDCYCRITKVRELK